MNRRRSLGLMGAALSGLSLPALAAKPTNLGTRRLILLTLIGGNDGLNTVVPYRDPLYRALRPKAGLAAASVLPLNDELALHPALGTAAALYQAGELAVLQDVGYPQARLSHFESAAIWDSADTANGTRAIEGWWAEVVRRNAASFSAAQLDAAAISFSADDMFASGPSVPLLRMRRDLGAFFSEAQATLATSPQSRSGLRGHLAEMVDSGERVRLQVAARLRNAPRPTVPPFSDPIDMQVMLSDWLLSNGVRSPVLRLRLDGFDTHSELLARHGDLMTTLDRGLQQLSTRLRASGLWRDTLIVVSSEFGRRPKENAAQGTDHGTAGPVLLLGGAVRGGIHGQRAALDQLDAEGNLHHTTDFRSLYSTVIDDWFGLPVNPLRERGLASVGGLLAGG